MVFPEGERVFDRCEKHDKKFIALREEKGEWVEKKARGSRAQFKVTSVEDIQRQRRPRRGT